ncbi:sigma factor [Piscinibacter sakaiensis]|uniref:sigma factor n=1 Tax=Piscinibacter sakaiensis TaxID=1547922 RepID=UPI0037263838
MGPPGRRLGQTAAVDEPSDDALLQAWAAGDAAAFERLYARHQAGLYRFVRRLLGTPLAAQADEVFQEAWLRVLALRGRWQPQAGRPTASPGRPGPSRRTAPPRRPRPCSGGGPASACSPAWRNCRCRSAASSCCTTRTG